MSAPPFPHSVALPWWKGCAAAALAVGLAAAFNVFVPDVARTAPYMAFHAVPAVVAWVSRSLRCAWLTVLVSAVAGNVLSIAPTGELTLSGPQFATTAAFVLVQGAFSLSVVLLRRGMVERDLLLRQTGTERDRLFALFAQAPITLLTYRGPDLVVDFVSPGAQQLAQRPVLGRRLRDAFADLDGQGLLELVERVYRTGEPVTLVERPVRYLRSDGLREERFLDASHTPLRDALGRVEGVLTCAVDVTARVHARSALERTERQLHRLSEAGLLGIVTWTGERITGANARLLEILGFPAEGGVPDGGINWVAMTPPEFREQDVRALAELEATGRTTPYQKQFVRPDGTRVWILGGAALIERDPLRGVSFVLDITAQKEAEHALQEAHQFEQRLLGIVSHDLRNPLASIRLGLDLLQRTVKSEAQLRTVSRMARSTERMHQLVAGLLDLTRLRAGQQLPVSREASNIHLLVERAVEEVSVADPGRITLSTHGDGTGEWDTVRLGQALSNLLGNALQHSPPGSPVQARVEGGPEQVEVAITNRGDPIPPDQLAGLFEPFRRGVRPGALDGSLGLGLYIAWHVARAHEGSLEVSSSVEQGTTFRLILPKLAPSGALPVLKHAG
jgi:PAS domain S-box-containing protein